MALMRLQKFLSGAGVCSRRKAEVYIKDGRVSVNGKTVTELGTKVDPQIDRIELDGQRVVPSQDLIYIALNKPKGYIASCTRDRAEDDIVLDLLDIGETVFIGAKERKETRGMHVRSDYSFTNPLLEKFLLVKKVKNKPVTQWADIKR